MLKVKVLVLSKVWKLKCVLKIEVKCMLKNNKYSVGYASISLLWNTKINHRKAINIFMLEKGGHVW